MQTVIEPKSDSTEAQARDGEGFLSKDWLEHLLQRAKDITEEIKEELRDLYPKGARCTYRTWHMKNDLPGVVEAVDVYQNRPLVYVKPDHKPRGRWMPANHVHCSNAEVRNPHPEKPNL